MNADMMRFFTNVIRENKEKEKVSNTIRDLGKRITESAQDGLFTAQIKLQEEEGLDIQSCCESVKERFEEQGYKVEIKWVSLFDKYLIKCSWGGDNK